MDTNPWTAPASTRIGLVGTARTGAAALVVPAASLAAWLGSILALTELAVWTFAVVPLPAVVFASVCVLGSAFALVATFALGFVAGMVSRAGSPRRLLIDVGVVTAMFHAILPVAVAFIGVVVAVEQGSPERVAVSLATLLFGGPWVFTAGGCASVGVAIGWHARSAL